MQRCGALRRSALILFLLPPSSELHPRTIVYICSERLSMVVHGPNKSTGRPRYGVSALCAVASRSATQAIPLFNLSHQRNATLTNGGKTALTSALLRAAKRASTRRRGPERQLRARVQCPWQCCQPGAPPFSALRKNPALKGILELHWCGGVEVT